VPEKAVSYARGVRLGVLILPEHRLPALTEKWSRAEGLGFDHAWTYDHIAWRELRDSPWFAAVPTLAVRGRRAANATPAPWCVIPQFGTAKNTTCSSLILSSSSSRASRAAGSVTVAPPGPRAACTVSRMSELRSSPTPAMT
jgi:hypothetical protein